VVGSKGPAAAAADGIAIKSQHLPGQVVGSKGPDSLSLPSRRSEGR
jgi:hypothetical protein